MLPFPIQIKPGKAIAEQVTYAVKRAVVSGLLAEGTVFPSVRVLSQELRINPNTAHKIIAGLVNEGVLITTPAVGSVVAKLEEGAMKDKSALLDRDVEKLVVEAMKLGLSSEDVLGSVRNHWTRLGGN